MYIHFKKLCIIMLGVASLDQNGGIATLEKLVLKYAPDIQIQSLASHHEGIAYQLPVFRKSWSLLSGRLLIQKVDLAHIPNFDGCSLTQRNYLMRFPIAPS